MSPSRLTGSFLHGVLILYSSTAQASEFCHYSYLFYTSLLGFAEAGGLMLGLARKGAHFLLFFSLGSWLFHSFRRTRKRNLFLATLGCLLLGAASEALQLAFPQRQASLADVVLNAASGSLAAALAAALDRSLAMPGKPILKLLGQPVHWPGVP